RLPIRRSDAYTASALVRHGLMPCSPITINSVITIDALELYRVAYHRNPHFSIQAFVKTLCDLHGVDFRRYLSCQFSIAFDVYLQVRSAVDVRVAAALQRDSPDWRLTHSCPACTYTLQDEAKMKFKLLYAIDGNDSLKRIHRKLLEDEEAEGASATSCELLTFQKLVCDRYLSRDFVDQFAKQPEGASMPTEDAEFNPCAGRWKNMDDQKTKKTWGVYDETGIMLAVCRHGFSLVLADMVQSGELAKYPVAIISKLLNAFGSDLGGGYDIGCQFKTTLASSAIGTLAREKNHTCLVGAFHGHAHRRLCQLENLTTYISGLGLEDLETCERTFSKSNALASTVRYASIFHRKQAISGYFKHNDEYEIYGNLSKFLYDNYKQALECLRESETALPKLKHDLNMSDYHVFEKWLADEKAYLQSLSKEPEEETLQMEYWKRLGALAISGQELGTARVTFAQVPTPTNKNLPSYQAEVKATRKAETARRHAYEKYAKDLSAVQELESKLDIKDRWTPEDVDWQRAARLVANREYQRALDNLEGLVVARIFELSKINRAGTAKALQARSSAIRTALERYNTAALAMEPARRTLEWDEVVEYAFLADFDLLRDVHQDVSQRPWATPAGRAAMDAYFKKCRAEEEIHRLNIEMQRLLTYIRDEEDYLLSCEDKLMPASPVLAHQVAILRNIRGRFNEQHIKYLLKISQLQGFSGTLTLGKSAHTGPGESASNPDPRIPGQMSIPAPGTRPHAETLPPDTQEDLEDEEDMDDNVAEASSALQDVLTVSLDTTPEQAS
ncbi:hypothetical protein HYDPIDRAFT_102653, partial [Hydnomerulius pinastri MD-312]